MHAWPTRTRGHQWRSSERLLSRYAQEHVVWERWCRVGRRPPHELRAGPDSYLLLCWPSFASAHVPAGPACTRGRRWRSSDAPPARQICSTARGVGVVVRREQTTTPRAGSWPSLAPARVLADPAKADSLHARVADGGEAVTRPRWLLLQCTADTAGWEQRCRVGRRPPLELRDGPA